MLSRLLLITIALLTSIIIFSQKGIIRGKITDANTGEELPFVNVYVKTDVSKGTSSDFEGNYTLKLEPGTYEIVVSFVSYSEQLINIKVEAGKNYTQGYGPIKNPG